jgi:pectate lyase
MHALLIGCLLVCGPLAAGQAEALPAFPGAEGFGAVAKGGRGGRVIRVTNLDADGPGSLTAACREKGPRIIVFAVSGVIAGDVLIEHGDVSIMGQTAPGAGITIAGSLKSRYRAGHAIDDIVIRFLRVRPLKAAGAGGDAIQLSENRRVIVDHVSAAWATDETVDIYGAQDVTIQWCTLEESLITGHPKGRHNYGLISGPNGKRVSIHHNLFAHHSRRCPAIANGPADVRNNVVYDFRDGFGHENRPNDQGYNVVANYYKRGPSDPSIFPFCFQAQVSYYLRDNLIDGVGIVQDPWAEAMRHRGLQYYAKSGRKADKEFPVPHVTTTSAAEAYELVLRRAGALPHDAVTRRTVQEVRSGTGKWGRTPQADLLEGLTPVVAPRDADGDGLPDAWETAHKLDAQGAADAATRMPSGYTAIEEYCHELAAQRLAEADRK